MPLFVGTLLLIVQRLRRESSRRLRVWVLDAMFLGGAGLLALEHSWAGEIVPWPPFLTFMAAAADLVAILNETLFVGGALTVATTGVWALILLATKTNSRTWSLKETDLLGKPFKRLAQNNRAPS